MDTQTPRTDAEQKWTFGDNRPGMSFECVKVEFAQELEKELAKAKRLLATKVKKQAQPGDLKHSPEYLMKLLDECEAELELKTIAMTNARKWESLSATEVCSGNPAIAEYVASLESRLAQSKKLYDLTLGNQMVWMRRWKEKSNEVAELHAKDSVRTREYNTLVQENRALHAALSASENDEMRDRHLEETKPEQVTTK